MMALTFRSSRIVYYGPHPCSNCGVTIAKMGMEFGGTSFTYPDGPIYPNTEWHSHVCDPHSVQGKDNDPAPPDARPNMRMIDDSSIKKMVDRFLQWKLPRNFSPDCGISFQKKGNEGTPHEYEREPVGTNLLDAAQAEVMVRYIVEGLVA